MATFHIDNNKVKGKIKPMHGVGQPPFSGGGNFKMFRFLTEAGIPYSRLHDVGGAYGNGRFVDIPNLFRNFDADETLPESYSFAFTDGLIKALVEAGVEPVFRLGVTIENDVAIEPIHIYPPKDNAKWARICEHIIMHYTEGWADGFHYDIKYWEIWNEPDNFPDINDNQMWRGTKEQYYELYTVTAKHLKARFPNLKIGGYASCGFYFIKEAYNEAAKSTSRTGYFIEFFDGFIEYIKKHGAPLDFFSWHSYDKLVENNIAYANYARERLDAAGYTETETSCNEWNTDTDKRGTCYQAAKVAANLLAFQDTPLDNAMFYDARFGLSVYGNLFDPMTKLPSPAYYAFTAFNRLYTRGTEIEVKHDIDGVYAVAAKGERDFALVISNYKDTEYPLEIDGGKPLYFIVTDLRGCDRYVEKLDTLPPESIVTVILK